GPRARWIAALSPLLLPLAAFVATTPQSFAYFLGIIAVALSLYHSHEPSTSHSREPSLCHSREGGNLVAVRPGLDSRLRGNDNLVRYIAPIIFSLWSLAAHPLAGLPFVGITLLLLVRQRMWKIIFLIFSILSTPLALAANSLVSHASISWNFSSLLHAQTYASWFSFLIPPLTHSALWADWSVFVGFLVPFLLIIGTIIAILKSDRRTTWIWITSAAVGLTLVGALLKTTGDFTFLIDYERGNYADRLFLIAQFFLLFPALDGFAWFFERASDKTRTLSVILLILSFIFGAQVYLALPRHDATIIGHGWSVGETDLKAVTGIDLDAGEAPYTVLANQSVSAAAIERLGFKRYAGDIFFYPIPTGGPLYQLYLDATDTTVTRATLQKAADLGKSKLVYVVLNDYWWNAERVGERLKSIADASVRVGNVRVFKFQF
ncbi:MAG: hypothetical protein Q7R83_00410, partial [bacterium]|nr:hypothetical protein [bacterium]